MRTERISLLPAPARASPARKESGDESGQEVRMSRATIYDSPEARPRIVHARWLWFVGAGSSRCWGGFGRGVVVPTGTL